jgi:hypothetical protein
MTAHFLGRNSSAEARSTFRQASATPAWYSSDPNAEFHKMAPRASVDYCVFVEGTHYAGPECPHFNEHDEIGEIYPPGWTAQSALAKDTHHG